jgi:histidyl-tRNA synthetase
MNKRKVKKVLESANRNGVPYVIILGENEIKGNTLEIKDMVNSTNIKVNLNDIEKMCEFIEKR